MLKQLDHITAAQYMGILHDFQEIQFAFDDQVPRGLCSRHLAGYAPDTSCFMLQTTRCLCSRHLLVYVGFWLGALND